MATPAEDPKPAGAVCDPVTGVCKLPARAGASVDGAGGLIPLPKTLRPLATLEDEDGNAVDPSLFKGKMVGVYVSAGWCPPCRVFSPLLSKWAKERKDDIAVVLVSLDNSEKEMRDFAAGKGFARLPFEPKSGRDNAAESFGVQALPTLVIVNGDTGAIVTTWGRSAISKNPNGCLKEWKAGRAGVTWLQLLKPW